jgi:hypothetical protein
MGKSAEVIDGKGVAMAPLCKRVRKLLEIKEIDRKGRKQKVESRNQKGAKQDRRKELAQEGGNSVGRSGENHST